jgi:hypothetical protein
VQQIRVADESGYGSTYLRCERQRPDQGTFVKQWDQLQVGCLRRVRDAVPFGAHVTHQTLTLESIDLRYQGGDDLFVEQALHGTPALLPELPKVVLMDW